MGNLHDQESWPPTVFDNECITVEKLDIGQEVRVLVLSENLQMVLYILRGTIYELRDTTREIILKPAYYEQSDRYGNAKAGISIECEFPINPADRTVFIRPIQK